MPASERVGCESNPEKHESEERTFKEAKHGDALQARVVGKEACRSAKVSSTSKLGAEVGGGRTRRVGVQDAPECQGGEQQSSLSKQSRRTSERAPGDEGERVRAVRSGGGRGHRRFFGRLLGVRQEGSALEVTVRMCRFRQGGHCQRAWRRDKDGG